MVCVIWPEKAAADLELIYDFIAADSPFYARVQVERLIAAAERLQVFPESGRTVPEFPHLPYREVISGSYRIIYRYAQATESVFIITVAHAARLLYSNDLT